MATPSSSSPAPNERQSIPVVKSDDSARLDRSAELIALLDATIMVPDAYVSLTGVDAEHILRLWASARGLGVNERIQSIGIMGTAGDYRICTLDVLKPFVTTSVKLVAS